MKTGTIVKASPTLRETSSRFLQAGFYTLLENTGEGCFILDEEFNIVYLNETANQISQNTYDIVYQVGDNLLELAPLNRRERLGQILFDARHGHTVKVVVEFIKPDGSRIYTDCKYAPIQTDQSFAGICLLLKDVSLQKALEASENEKQLIEAKHQESLQLFQQFMENSPLRAWITDKDGKMHYINLLHQKFLGLTDDYKGKTLHDIFPEEIARQYAADDQAALYASKPIEIIQKAIKPNGKKGIFKVYKFPVLIKNERMIAGWAIEITEQIRLQKELLKQEQKSKRKLIRSIITTQEKERRQFSVELHDNVNQIISSCKLMLEVARENESRRLELIEKSYQSLKEVIAEIRKISHDLNPSALEDIGLVEAISEMVERINVAGKLRIEFDRLRYRIMALNPEKSITIYRIVQEGLNNIVKHANASNVWITLYSNDAHILVTIRDNGTGFDLNNTKKGLGLRNISHRVEYSLGKMRVQTSPGHGCTLKVLIPIPKN